MGALVLQYHPVEESFSTALLDATVAGLEADGVDTRIIRIRNTDGPDDQRLRLTPDDLLGVEHLVAVYPTWWGALPARLLQVVTDLLADVVDGDRYAASSPLREVEQLTVVTTHGSSRLINRLQGEPGLMLWKHTVVDLCAPGCRFEWRSLYAMDHLDEAQRAAFVDEVRRGFRAVAAPSA